MKNIQYLLLAILLLTSSGITQTKWKVDKSHTMINFTVSHMVVSEVSGQFNEFDATMESTSDDFTDAKIVVTIKAKSIDTGTERRDNHLRGEDFFNTDVDSIITFTSSRMEKISADSYKIYGQLTMRGVTKDVILDSKFKGCINGRNGKIAAFKATTSIPRKEWGLNWNRTIEAGGLAVGEIVDLTILIEFNEIKS